MGNIYPIEPRPVFSLLFLIGFILQSLKGWLCGVTDTRTDRRASIMETDSDAFLRRRNERGVSLGWLPLGRQADCFVEKQKHLTDVVASY